ncbi:hypothetical protein [Pseudorhodobacter ferrugineus]|nr:hypothetical protein [Pseudorhodobacter ferrugineus]
MALTSRERDVRFQAGLNDRTAVGELAEYASMAALAEPFNKRSFLGGRADAANGGLEPRITDAATITNACSGDMP